MLPSSNEPLSPRITPVAIGNALLTDTATVPTLIVVLPAYVDAAPIVSVPPPVLVSPTEPAIGTLIPTEPVCTCTPEPLPASVSVRGVALFSSDQPVVLNVILLAVISVPTVNAAAPAENTASLVL